MDVQNFLASQGVVFLLFSLSFFFWGGGKGGGGGVEGEGSKPRVFWRGIRCFCWGGVHPAEFVVRASWLYDGTHFFRVVYRLLRALMNMLKANRRV